MRLDRVACRRPGCNLNVVVCEDIGTTCSYFEFCPSCGAEHSLTTWTVELRGGIEYQVYKGDVVPYE